MTPNPLLLQAILDSPDEDAARLIYADWLEEHGASERAEFIRVQCELARLDQDDPRWRRLEIREWQLLVPDHPPIPESEYSLPPNRAERYFHQLINAIDPWPEQGIGPQFEPERTVRGRGPDQHGHSQRGRRPEWVRPLSDWAASGGVWLFRRGFLEGVQLRPDFFLKHGTQLFDQHPLRALEVNSYPDLTAATAAELQASSLLQRLTKLSILERGWVEMEPLLMLLRSPHLHDLRQLRIYCSHATSDLPRTLARQPQLAHLTGLSLCGYHQPGDAGLSALASSPYLLQLRSLELGGYCPLAATSLQALAQSPICAHLTSLTLRHLEIGEAAARELAASPHLANLRVLNLSNNNVRTPGVEALAASPQLAHLTALDLSENGIGDAGARELVQSPQLRNLRSLWFTGNRLTYRGKKLLKSHFGPGLFLDWR